MDASGERNATRDDDAAGGGKPTCTTPDLTPTDEAALLAEYGAQGPYDSLLDIAAPSHFRSDYGDLSVFLTTADAHDRHDTADGCPMPVQASDDLICPSLEALLVKYTGVLSDAAAPSLVDHLSHAIEEMTTSSSSSYAARRRQQDEALLVSDDVEHHASLPIVDGGVGAGGGEDDGRESLMQLLQESDRLLDEAGKWTRHDDVTGAETSSPSLTARLKAIREEEDVLCHDAYDMYLDAQADFDRSDDNAAAAASSSDEGSSSTRAVLAEAHAHVAAWRCRAEAPTALPEDRAPAEVVVMLSGTTKDVTGEPPTTPPPPLYAFEVCPTKEERARLTAWLAVEQRSRTQHARRQAVVLRNAHEDPMAPPDPVLDAIVNECASRERALAEARPAVLETIATLSRPCSGDQSTASAQVVQVTPAHDAAARERALRRRRELEGYIVLQRFSERVDELIAPAPEELALRNELTESHQPPRRTSSAADMTGAVDTVVVSSDGGGENEAGAERAVAPRDKAKRDVTASTKAIQRRSAILCWRLEREAMERQCMRQEEQYMASLTRAAEDRRVALAQALVDCVQESEARHHTLYEEERQAFVALRASAQRQGELARRAATLREVAMASQLAQEMLCEHATAAHAIHVAESHAFVELKGQVSRAYDEALLRTYTRRRVELERLNEAFAHIRRNALLPLLMSHPTDGDGGSSSSTALDPYADLSTLCCSTRVVALLEERADALQWTKHYNRLWTSTLQRLQDELARHTATGQPRPATQHVTSPVRGATADTITATCLDESLVRRVQAPVVAAAETARRAADVRILAFALSFALEQIHHVDWAGLTGMKIRYGGHKGTSNGASWASVALTPLVRQLDLSGNQFATIDLAALLSTFPSLMTLTLSGNALAALSEGRRSAMGREVPMLPRSASVRGVVAAQTSAFAAQLHLHRVDLSNNQLCDLSCVGALLANSLTELVAYTNRIDSAAALVTCQRLRRLDLSHNRLTNLDDCASLALLCELNVCDNAITDAHPLALHNGLLQKLYISHNPLSRAVRPAASLCMPFLTQLFVNHAGLRSLDAVMTAMPLLSVLHAEGNELSELTPLMCCPRLVALKLSFNRLARFDALRPLASCRGLALLDVSENPFIPGYHPHGTGVALDEATRDGAALPQARRLPPDMHDALLYMLPNLRELNHEPVCRVHHTQAHARAAAAVCMNRDPLPLFAELRLAAPRRHCLTATLIGDAAGRGAVYRRVFDALGHDAALTELRTRLDVQALASARRVQAAEAASQSGPASLTSQQWRLQYVAQCRAEAECAALAEVRNTLRALQSLTVAETTRDGNVFCRSATYTESARRHREQLARRAIATWCDACVLGQRARAEARRLRDEGARLTLQRQAWAVSVIQPIWRGAVLRSRLRRLLPVSDDEEDDATYCKVEVPFAEVTLADKTAAGLGLGVVVRQVMDAHVPLPRFAVSAGPVRAGTAPTGADSGAAQTLSLSQGAGDALGRRGSHRPPAPTTTTPTRLGNSRETSDDARSDGVDYAALVARKRRKMQTVHQQFLRQEFMRDPLKAKRLEASSSCGKRGK